MRDDSKVEHGIVGRKSEPRLCDIKILVRVGSIQAYRKTVNDTAHGIQVKRRVHQRHQTVCVYAYLHICF